MTNSPNKPFLYEKVDIHARHVTVYSRYLMNLFECLSFTDDDLPLFPVQQNYMSGVKARVNLARDIDKKEHR